MGVTPVHLGSNKRMGQEPMMACDALHEHPLPLYQEFLQKI
jgi:hypothetical protein